MKSSPFSGIFPDLMTKSQLIIARSGASSIAEIMAMGLPSILIPFAAASNDEQTINSRSLEKAGCGNSAWGKYPQSRIDE